MLVQYKKTQAKLRAIKTYLDNIQSMLQECSTMLQNDAYPLEGLEWLSEKGIPVIRQKVMQEHAALTKYVEKTLL